MSKFFFALAVIALAAYLVGLVLMVWHSPDDLDATATAAKVCVVGAVVFIPSLAIYCEMEDRKSGSD